MAMTNAERCAKYRKSQKGKEAAARREESREAIRLNLHSVHDADIIAAIDPKRPKATQYKELLRLGIEAKKNKA